MTSLISPQPRVPEASVYKAIDGDVDQLLSKKKDVPLQVGRKASH